MFNGHLQFIAWASKHFEYLKTKPSNITYEMILGALRENLKTVIISHYRGYSISIISHLFNSYRNDLGLSNFACIKELIKIKLGLIPKLDRASRALLKMKNLIFK